MDDSKTFDLIQSVKHQLAAYEVIQCALAHERVVSISHDDDGTHPDHPGWQFALKGFCDKSARTQRLGCAHTMANTRYRNLVNEIIAAGLADDLIAPLAEVDEIVMSIYRTDHEKGRLDKQCAVCREDGKASELHQAEQKLRALLASHFKLVERLSTLHRHILRRLDELTLARLPAPAE